MATFRFRLSDADRKRLGVGDEWLDLDVFSVSAWEAALMQRGFTREGVTVSFDHPRAWRQALVGKSADGPRRPDWGAELMAVWLLLRRAGIDVPMAELDYDADGMSWDLVLDLPPAADEAEVPGESAGKDDAVSPSGPPNPQTSPT